MLTLAQKIHFYCRKRLCRFKNYMKFEYLLETKTNSLIPTKTSTVPLPSYVNCGNIFFFIYLIVRSLNLIHLIIRKMKPVLVSYVIGGKFIIELSI